jgi:hypothetical protein
MKTSEAKDRETISAWVDTQAAWVYSLAVSAKPDWRLALPWHVQLLKAGWQFPLFVVLDIGTLIQQNDRWKANREPLPAAGAKWQRLQHNYARGLHFINRLLQSEIFPKMPFQKKERLESGPVASLIPALVSYLGWQQAQFHLPAPGKINYAELIRLYNERFNDFETQNNGKFKKTFSQNTPSLFDVILAWEGNFRKLSPSPSFWAASWTAAIASNWRQPEHPRNGYWQGLDYHAAQKYLANFSPSPAVETLQHLQIPSREESVMPAESKKYTSYDRVTRHGVMIAPSELLYLVESEAEEYFWSKWAEGSLLTLGTKLEEDKPSEAGINFVIPALREMALSALAEDDQSFMSYAKYLTLLLWHDYISLYVDSGCSETNLFSFNLFLNQPGREKKWQEKKYAAIIREELVKLETGYMLRLGWAAGDEMAAGRSVVSYTETLIDLFYHPDLARYCSLKDEPDAASGHDGERRAPHNYWMLFAPEQYLLGLAATEFAGRKQIEVPPESALAKILRKKGRRYKHFLAIGFGNLELYEVLYGVQITLKKISKQKSRVDSEREIRKFLLRHFVNEFLLPALRKS